MGNRVYLELRGSDLSAPAGADEEAVASLAASNSLPLFWLALLREENLGAAWESGVRDVFANLDGSGMEPVCLGWREARANLAAACAVAKVRLPSLFPWLREWEAGLVALASQGPTQEVRLFLAEHANFYDSADEFIGRVREIVRLWHGTNPPAVPPVEDAGSDLTGFFRLTDKPFPTAFPSRWPVRPALGSLAPAAGVPAQGRIVGQAAEWGMVVLFSAIVIGFAILGARYLGSGGIWMGGAGGCLVASAVVWRWARWPGSR